jgi:hypothetical protein
MHLRWWSLPFGGALAVVGSVLFAEHALAEPQVTLRAEAASATTSGTGVGVGGDLRLGYEVGVPALFFAPQVGLGYHRFTGDDGPDVSVLAPYAGARVGLGTRIRPYLDGHVGGARRAYDPSLPADGWSPYFDVGAGLGFVVGRIVELGGHANLGFVPATTRAPELNWIGFGVDITLTL